MRFYYRHQLFLHLRLGVLLLHRKFPHEAGNVGLLK